MFPCNSELGLVVSDVVMESREEYGAQANALTESGCCFELYGDSVADVVVGWRRCESCA